MCFGCVEVEFSEDIVEAPFVVHTDQHIERRCEEFVLDFRDIPTPLRQVKDFFMQRNDEINFGFPDGGFDRFDVSLRINVRSGGVPGFLYGAREFANVVFHWVNDEDCVTDVVELAGEVEGDGKAAIC